MKTVAAVSLSGLAAGLLLLAGCGTPPQHTVPFTKAEIREQPEVKDKAPAVFPNPLQDVHKAGRRALNFVGCDLITEEPFFLAGKRPSKFGLFGDSGGEVVKIFLYPKTEQETHVWVDTEFSFFGAAGQQAWNNQVLLNLTNLLCSPMMGGVQ